MDENCFLLFVGYLRVNTSTVYVLANNLAPTKVNSFDFGVQLADALIKPYVSVRSISGLTSNIRSKMILYTGENSQQAQGSRNDTTYERMSKKGRCRLCMDGIQGDGYKEQKERLTQVKTNCEKCGRKACKQHSMLQCSYCLEK